MKRRTQAQWQALIEAHAGSGMTAASFCREHRLNARYFSLRRRQLGGVEGQASTRFVSVSVSKPLSGERITVRDPSGAVIELPVSVSPQWLAQLLQALRG